MDLILIALGAVCIAVGAFMVHVPFGFAILGMELAALGWWFSTWPQQEEQPEDEDTVVLPRRRMDREENV